MQIGGATYLIVVSCPRSEIDWKLTKFLLDLSRTVLGQVNKSLICMMKMEVRPGNPGLSLRPSWTPVALQKGNETSSQPIKTGHSSTHLSAQLHGPGQLRHKCKTLFKKYLKQKGWGLGSSGTAPVS
jgi:hypothetical protein